MFGKEVKTMTKKDVVLKEILELSPLDRVDIVEKIFTSLENSSNKEIDEIWGNEAEKRIHGYLSGQLKTKSLREVFNRLNNEL